MTAPPHRISSSISSSYPTENPSSSSSSPSSSSYAEYEYPALCIPRGLGKITHDELKSIIQKSGLGEVSKIIIKPKEFVLPVWERTVSHHHHPSASPQTVCYNNIYIYFKKWNTDNPTVRKYRDNIINGQSIKIVHNTIPTPIFWRCIAANFHNHKNKI
jgi:hypothetical protein